MAHRTRIRPTALVVAGVLVIVVVMMVSDGDDTGATLPRLRASIPGLDKDIDLFAVESEPESRDGARSDVIEIESIDQIQVAFDAGQGHPRLILLVDPI